MRAIIRIALILTTRKANAKQQQDYLKTILEREMDENSSENCVQSNDELNQMLARSEEEFKLFSQMDKEREQNDKEWKTGTRRQRLIDRQELPPWMLHDDETIAKFIETVIQ